MESTNLEKSEVKQQGAFEIAEKAVQDPQSNIRPELVNKVLVEETGRVGVPLSQLDPDASELKQQGVIEMAEKAVKDPQSNIRPELVEKVLVEETRKAGVPAYQFDPNASTEEKRAVVQAVSCLLFVI
jgi:hypothetical protein